MLALETKFVSFKKVLNLVGISPNLNHMLMEINLILTTKLTIYILNKYFLTKYSQ